MKTLIKKSLLVLMLVFVSVFALGLNTKVRAEESVATFEFGENGTASHADGSALSSTHTYTDGDYSLGLTAVTKAYGDARDAKGNSCIKLGTGSAAGSFSFTVPDDVIKVEIYVAQYKANTTKISVNDTAYTITTASNNGEYTTITVDTSSNKTVSFTTVSGGYRCMINTIKYYVAESSTPDVHEHDICTVCNKCKTEECTEYGNCLGHGLSISGDSYTQVNNTCSLTANLENITGDIVWNSSDENVATIDENGNVSAHAVGKTNITVTVGDFESSIEFVVYPTAGSELTIADALEVCDLTGSTNCPYEYSLTGVVKTINTAYDSTYNNITVTVTDGTNSIQSYRLSGGSDLAVGDKITITGTLIKYSGTTPQFNAGATYETVADDDATAAAKEALNAVQAYLQLAYTYEVKQLAIATLDFSSQGYENGVAVESLENSGIKVVFSKGTNSSGNVPKYYDTGTAIRCYGGNTFTISSSDTVKITQIVLTFSTGEGTNEITVSDGTYSGNVWSGSSNTVTFTVAGTSGHRRINKIEVYHSGEGELTALAYSNVEFRLRCGVDASITDIANVDDYGICVSTANGSFDYSSTSEFIYPEESETDGNKACVTLNLGDALNKSSLLSLEFTVCAYVVIDGVTYYSETTKTHSIASMVEKYHGTTEYTSDVQGLYDILVSKGLITE